MICSTSWGSILSAKLLEKNPFAVDCVIACGQIVKNVLIGDEVKSTLEKSNIPAKKLERIKKVTVDNFIGKDLQLISSSLHKYTNAYQNKNSENRNLNYRVVSNTGHMPGTEMMDALLVLLKECK